MFLRFGGLDTLADAYLNDVPLGHFENMFREYAIEVTGSLAAAGQPNVLTIVFASPLRYMRAAGLPAGDPAAAPHKSLRKCHSDFSSYLGARPHAVKVGVYRDVVLDMPEQSWIEDVRVRSTLSQNFDSAKIDVQVETGGNKVPLRWILNDSAGREVSHGETFPSGTSNPFEIAVDAPQLWWPRSPKWTCWWSAAARPESEPPLARREKAQRRS